MGQHLSRLSLIQWTPCIRAEPRDGAKLMTLMQKNESTELRLGPESLEGPCLPRSRAVVHVRPGGVHEHSVRINGRSSSGWIIHIQEAICGGIQRLSPLPAIEPTASLFAKPFLQRLNPAEVEHNIATVYLEESEHSYLGRY